MGFSPVLNNATGSSNHGDWSACESRGRGKFALDYYRSEVIFFVIFQDNTQYT